MLAAFEGHPTPMTWTPAVIRHVHDAPGFDPSGILVVDCAATHRSDRWRSAVIRARRARPPAVRTGEVGLIGVLPAWRGRGLGRELLRWGVDRAAARGAGAVELSVEAPTSAPPRCTARHGFEPAIEWPHWVLPVG